MLSLGLTQPFQPPLEGTQMVVFSDIKNYTAEYEAPRYIKKCINYAKEYNVYLVTGRFVATNFLCMAFIGPDGQVIGVQRATHLNLTYQTALKRSTDLDLYDTPFGRIFLCVDVDIYHPEVLRSAVMRGAKLIISSQYIEFVDYGMHTILQGAYNAAMSYGATVVNVNNNSRCILAGKETARREEQFLLPLGTDLPVMLSIDLDDPAIMARRSKLEQGCRPDVYRAYAAELER